MSQQFEMKPCDNRIVRKCMAELNLPHFIVSTCVARGYDSAEKINKYLNPSIEKDWGNPLDIPGMEEVASNLQNAILNKKRIVVFGDFDLDGISATTVLTRGLRALGANVTPFIPDRFKHGYGLSLEAFEELKPLNPDIIITVDCGIANKKEVAEIVAKGVEVIVTDHHESGDLVPEGVVICDPKHKGSEEDSTLAGVGVALKVIQAVGSRFGFPHLWRSYTDFATLGTIADMMPLRSQNRALINDGVEKIKTQCRPCLRALFESSGVNPSETNAHYVSFSCVPRLNASGRLGKANVSLNLLLSDTIEESLEHAKELDTLNTKRRNIETELSKLALEKASSKWKGQRCLCLSGENWHEGVKGIVAARVVDKYQVPSIIFTIDGDEARGSGRSVGDIDLFSVVNEQSDILTRYGGHKGAVGITLPSKNLEAFEQRMNESLKQFDEAKFKKTIKIDTVVSLDELTLENVKMLEKCGPFGQENEKPLLLAKNVTEFDGRPVGVSGSHYLCKLSNGQSKISCIEFNCKNIKELQDSNAVVNAIFSVETETWHGTTSVKAKAESLLPLTECPALSSLCSDASVEFIEGLFQYKKFNACNQIENSSDVEDEKSTRDYYENLARTNPTKAFAEIVKELIGEHDLHSAQTKLINHLKEGESTLGIMATGRGKSLVFQTHAAMIALLKNKQSIFVYPLRALIGDQENNLESKLNKFGINISTLNGETPLNKRNEIYKKVKSKDIDIILTTPEYLELHANELKAAGDFGFLVIDEAHHAAEIPQSRDSYASIHKTKELLGNPTTIALTATAPKEIQERLMQALTLKHKVIDDASRANLRINDQRNIAHRDDYLAHLLAQGKKTVVYVGTREQSIAVARRQRARVPQLAPYIGFYNAGLSRIERKRIEALFRNDDIQVLVATSAFGEGIDIPNIRNVVLYHMPTNEVEFNQMAGRAGRDGEESWIHLMYGKRDASINESILNELAPDRNFMAVIYKRILQAIKASKSGTFELDSEQFSKTISSVSIQGKIYNSTPNIIENALKVFCELDFFDEEIKFYGTRKIHFVKSGDLNKKSELTDSVKYCEGLAAQADFASYRDEALFASVADLTNRITHPIF